MLARRVILNRAMVIPPFRSRKHTNGSVFLSISILRNVFTGLEVHNSRTSNINNDAVAT